MDLATLSDNIAPDEARAAYREYVAVAKETGDPEHAAIAAGYRAIAQGKTVISLRDTIRAGGIIDVPYQRDRWDHDRGQHVTTTFTARAPALAVARAHWQWVWLAKPYWSDQYRFVVDTTPRHKGGIGLPAGMPVNIPTHGGLRAMVPLVPPQFRPRAKSLERYHVLFEAEWTHQVPVDPALLRHIRGDLYAVLATWDLTDLERAVLGARLEEPSGG